MLDAQQQRKEAFYVALSHIPKGKVITYGNLAKLAGLPNGARLAGRILCELPRGSHLPWHRVVNAQGRISLPVDSPAHAEQKQRLLKEGITFVKDKIKLSVYGLIP